MKFGEEEGEHPWATMHAYRPVFREHVTFIGSLSARIDPYTP
jgi:hypothetical protein